MGTLQAAMDGMSTIQTFSVPKLKQQVRNTVRNEWYLLPTGVKGPSDTDKSLGYGNN
jgi:hypothetical protein